MHIYEYVCMYNMLVCMYLKDKKTKNFSLLAGVYCVATCDCIHATRFKTWQIYSIYLSQTEHVALSVNMRISLPDCNNLQKNTISTVCPHTHQKKDLKKIIRYEG